MSEPFLTARALTKSYPMGRRTLEVLRGVSLEVARGEFLALRGASGAGKSTLLHLLGGLDTPNAGEIWFNGENLARLPEGAQTRLRNRHVGFIFQAYHLLPELDALENVCLPARIARVDAAQAEARGRELLRRVGLAERLEHKPYELSGGEQQRVAIARALVKKPSIILADEPTGNLDTHTGTQILDLLVNQCRHAQTTLIMVSHAMITCRYARRILQMVDGVVAEDRSCEAPGP